MKTCLACDKPTAPNRVRCPECLEKARLYQRAYQQKRKTDGFCAECGKRKPRPNRANCAHCAERRQRKSRERYQKYRREGLCPSCGKTATSDHCLCERCKAKSQRAHKHRRSFSLRSTVLARDDHCCRLCGATTRLVIHHRDGVRIRHDVDYLHTHPSNDPDNLITLCARCHRDLTHLSRVHHFALLLQLLEELSVTMGS